MKRGTATVSAQELAAAIASDHDAARDDGDSGNAAQGRKTSS
jgi:hypothetical protein